MKTKLPHVTSTGFQSPYNSSYDDGLPTKSSNTKVPSFGALRKRVSTEDLEIAKEEAIKNLAILPVIINALEELIEWRQEFKHRVEKEDRD